MTKELEVINNIEEKFDLNRIKNLSISEKFKLVKLAKLIYNESLFANQNGIQNLDQSENYTINKTYNLLAMLLVNGIPSELFEEIVLNYANNFKKSDSYYSQISILGIGLMLTVEEFKPESILSYLMMLLGKDFLLNNQNYKGYVDDLTHEAIKVTDEINYKAFEGQMRKVKYELLALLELHHEKDHKFIKEFINKKYGSERLKVYYNMLDVNDKEIQNKIYKEFHQDNTTMGRLLLSGAYALLNSYNIFSAHYLFNSIIGKYSRYNKEIKEITNEMNQRREELLSL